MLIYIKTKEEKKTMSRKKIIAATGNKGKLKEIKEIFPEYEILSSKEAGFDVDVEEDADTFEGNALKKREQLQSYQANYVQLMTLE